MSEPPSHRRTLVAALAEEARAEAGEHPDTDELLDYHAGRLEPQAEERLRNHFVGCRGCARRLLELEPLAEPDPGDEETVADFAMNASLRALEARIREQEVEPPSVRHRTAGRGGPARPSRRVLQAVAACLFAAVLGLAAWGLRLQGTAAELRRTVAALDQPRPNFAVAYLEPPADRGTSAAPVELPPGQPFWVLVLIPEDPRPRPEYEVTLLDSGGTELWRSRGLEMQDGAGISLALPSRMLPPGEYRLELHALDGDERTLEGEYALESPAD